MSKPQVTFQHSYTFDPLFEELERILIITQNSDGTWGTAESLDDRLYPTGWAVFALRTMKTNYPLKIVKEMLTTKIVPELEDHFQISKWIHAKKLCGLFLLLPCIHQEELWTNSKLFHKNIQALIARLENLTWINNQVASYLVFSCSSVSEMKESAQRARDYLRSVFLQQSSASEMAYACLGLPEALRDILKDQKAVDGFISEAEKLTDEQLSHLLLGLSLIYDVKDNQMLRNALSSVKEEIASRLRDRQLTELDKKVTKEFLDLLLLLRTMIPLDELRRRLKQLDNKILIQDVTKTNRNIRVVSEIPSGKLQEALGRIDIPTISCYVLSSINLKESQVFLVPEKDYVGIRDFFRTRTLPIRKRRLLTYEALLSLPLLIADAYVWYLLYLILSEQIVPYIGKLPIPRDALPILLPFFTLIINIVIFLGVLVFTIRVLKLFVPELANYVYEKVPQSLKRIARIIGGFSNGKP